MGALISERIFRPAMTELEKRSILPSQVFRSLFSLTSITCSTQGEIIFMQQPAED
jgi:hypothetical protein